ncbi:molybdenum cofactor biosynthesis protein B [Alcanivorax sp. 1008]|uniref:molybdenum cofactor biosynthesis protein B n=1 Tax=Alcanivorax sp. 1008 TaxID=2816853 RepID=UPI001D7FFD6A|nr:molybdenum cofactor biosynthesis protein B [Alcanivorax sp. 1008]MCC1495930.1 molybdenum cofactor biosynthesis protein B [Alcanivorax sp. 1008]
MSQSTTEFVSLRIAVLTVSDTRTPDTDTSGALLVEKLSEAGHQLADRALLRDDIWQLREQVCRWVGEGDVQVILVTGGTGFTGRDSTPEALAPLFNKSVDGFGELFRQLSYSEIGTSTVQSRAVAGLADGVLICCLPGSTGACRTAWDGILASQLDSRFRPCNFVQHLRGGHGQRCG